MPATSRAGSCVSSRSGFRNADRMARLTKIYTRTGDKGLTGLVGGQRVSKDSPRIWAYGTVDELNSAIGLARAFKPDKKTDAILGGIQNDLFDLGAELAGAPGHV